MALVPSGGRNVNRFFRSALFPLIIIAALVWLALQTLGSHGTKTTQATTSRVYTLIRTGQVNGDGVTVDPNRQSLTLTTLSGQRYSVHYASPQAEASLEQTMISHHVAFNSKGVGGSPWWSILTSLLPFVLQIGRASCRERGGWLGGWVLGRL